MSTPSQLGQYCHEQLHMLYPAVATKGTHMTTMTSWLNWSLVGDVIIAFAAYEIGKRGLTAAYTSVRNLFAKSTTTAPVATPVAA